MAGYCTTLPFTNVYQAVIRITQTESHIIEKYA